MSLAKRKIFLEQLIDERESSVIASLHYVLSCCPLALSIETHKILRRGLLRGRDFLNSWCARA